jgi:hypothetical protein
MIGIGLPLVGAISLRPTGGPASSPNQNKVHTLRSGRPPRRSSVRTASHRGCCIRGSASHRGCRIRGSSLTTRHLDRSRAALSRDAVERSPYFPLSPLIPHMTRESLSPHSAQQKTVFHRKNLNPYFSSNKTCGKIIYFYNSMITSVLQKFMSRDSQKKRPQNRKISMMEHISLSFPPYCGIFNSTQRESSGVKYLSPHHRIKADTSCVTGLPARAKHRSCRIFFVMRSLRERLKFRGAAPLFPHLARQIRHAIKKISAA